MKYKIWVHIEEIDEEQDHYEDVTTPEELDSFDTLKDAQDFISSLTDEITVTVSGGVAECDDPRVEIIDYDNC